MDPIEIAEEEKRRARRIAFYKKMEEHQDQNLPIQVGCMNGKKVQQLEDVRH